MHRSLVATALLLALGLAVRVVDFERLMTFGPEQAMSLLTSAGYLSRFSLLGQPLWRTTTAGLQLFNSPLFNYSLLPLLRWFEFNPTPISAGFALLNWLTGALIFWLGRRLIGGRAALIAAILFLFSAQMIFHSRFIWIIHPWPLLGLLSLYLVIKKRYGSLGFLTGVGVGLDYTYVFFALPLLAVALWRAEARLKTLLTLVGAAVVGDLPWVIFELRHQFYNTRVLWQYFLETLAQPDQSQIAYYHFLPFWPVAAIGAGIILARWRKLAAIVLAAYLYLNLNSSLIWSTYPVSLAVQRQVAALIAADYPQNFNVVSLVDFDTRGHILRYHLQYLYGLVPRPVDEYARVDAVYALAPVDYDLTQPTNYELTSFWPYQIQVMQTLSDRLILYKLTKSTAVAAVDQDFVTWIFPVRGREYWRQGRDLSHLTNLQSLISSARIPSTWLLQYDVLADGQVVNEIAKTSEKQEAGLFLEVTRQLALDAWVNYPWESEKWERADKVFLSGYDPVNRIKLIDTAMTKFRQVFGRYPTSVGVWYIDGRSLIYLYDKYGVEAVLSVADQYLTDGYQIWGQYIGEPYYPSRGSVIEPALNNQDKIDVVKLQWAPREPLLSYGAGGEYSNYSAQANDFGRAKGLGMGYFSRLVKIYTTEVAAPVAQITLGIEVGELEDKYLPLVADQMRVMTDLKIPPVTMSEFAQIYKAAYPGVSPALSVRSQIGNKSIVWYQSPLLRSAILTQDGQSKLVDLRYYHSSRFYENDWNEADRRQNLYRVVPAEMDEVALGNSQWPQVPQPPPPRLANRGGELSVLDKIRRGLARFIPDIRASKLDGRWVIGWVKDAQTLCLIRCHTYPYPYLEAFLNLNKWRKPQLQWYSRWQEQLDNQHGTEKAVVKDSRYGIESLSKELVRPKTWENSYYQLF